MTIFIWFAMVVDVDGNGSFQNHTEDIASTSCSSRSAARKAASTWKELQKKKPRGRCFANIYALSQRTGEYQSID